MTKKSHSFWVLASTFVPERKGTSYQEVPHRFGWDAERQSFVMQTGTKSTYTPAPVELAEAFLCHCMEKDFKEQFLLDSTPAVQDQIEVGGTTLEFKRGAINNRIATHAGPNLSLILRQGEHTEHIVLCSHLRRELAQYLTVTPVEEIKRRLHHFSAAA